MPQNLTFRSEMSHVSRRVSRTVRLSQEPYMRAACEVTDISVS
jgi:hypothetical protein